MSQAPLRLPSDVTIVNMRDDERQRAVDAAMRVLSSPHEHTWTADEQATIALALLWATQRLGIIQRTAAGEPWEE